MSKLFKLKEWLTVKEAANHLSILFGEDISEATILRLALDGKLTLSLYLPQATYAKNAEEIPLPIEFDHLRDDCGDVIMSIEADKIILLDSVLDFPMIGTERLIFEAEYYRATMGKTFEINGSHQLFVKQNNKLYILQVLLANPSIIEDDDQDQMLREHAIKNYVEAQSLPEDGILVVRTSILRELEQELANSGNKNNTNDKESTRKTENLLRTLAAAAIDGYGYRPEDKKSPTPQQISDALNQLGVELDPKTIRNYLKDGVNLLPRKE